MLIKNTKPLKIYQLFYDNSIRGYSTDGGHLEFPAFIKKSQVKFNFKTQSKPYATIQDLPEYVSTINRSYDLEFEVIADNKVQCVENYNLLHEFLKLMKSNYEKSRNITLSKAGTEQQAGLITSYAINNAYINSRANFRIELESNPYIYNRNQSTEDANTGNIYDILMTSFDYKIDESHGYINEQVSFNNGTKKDSLIPVSFSISMGGLLLPENPNIYRNFKEKFNLSKITRSAEKAAKAPSEPAKVATLIAKIIGSAEPSASFIEQQKTNPSYFTVYNILEEKIKQNPSSEISDIYEGLSPVELVAFRSILAVESNASGIEIDNPSGDTPPPLLKRDPADAPAYLRDPNTLAPDLLRPGNFVEGAISEEIQ